MKLWLSLFVLVAAACGGRVKLDPQSNVAKQDGIVSMWAEWVKDKGDKYDIRMNIKNDSDQATIIMLNGLQCYRGQIPGRLKHTFFNTGERTMDFRPGELKTFNLVCVYGSDTKGDFRIVIDRIFENPSGDGRQTGKVVAQKIEWNQPDHQ